MIGIHGFLFCLRSACGHAMPCTTVENPGNLRHQRRTGGAILQMGTLIPIKVDGSPATVGGSGDSYLAVANERIRICAVLSFVGAFT